jgi:ketosteroid isomerase-like protein
MLSPASPAESEQLTRMRAAIERWTARDYEAVLDFLHPDVVWRIDPLFPDIEPVYEGREGVRRFFESFVEPWEQISLEIQRVIDERPGAILVRVKFIARARDGLEVDQAFPQIYRYDRDYRVIEFHGFTDEAAARREAGLADG